MIDFKETNFEFNDNFSDVEFDNSISFENRYVKPAKSKDVPYKKFKI